MSIIVKLKQYYDSGKDVVYYCYKARRTSQAWKKKMTELTAGCPQVRIIVLTYRRGTQRSYIFGIHPERYVFYDSMIRNFLKTNWGGALPLAIRIFRFSERNYRRDKTNAANSIYRGRVRRGQIHIGE